ncbi:MAG: hypothetical protein NT157_03725 [Candidatus Micrarchaeota archaeon]|nr:hypothetical protein [Candidatus Micrarchaeota archaeon]
MRVVCLGNKYVKGDDLVPKLCAKLAKDGFDSEVADGMDVDVLGGGDVVFVDVTKGIKNVRFVSPGELEVERTATAHDIDAGFYFRMMEKMGRKVKIIGIPYGMDGKKALAEVKKLLLTSARTSVSGARKKRRPRGRG